MIRERWWILMVWALIGASVHAERFNGDFYYYSQDDGLVTLSITQAADGRIEGQFVLDDYPVKALGRLQGQEWVGEIREGDGEVYPFRAQLFGGKLNMAFDDGDYYSLSPGKAPADLVARARESQDAGARGQPAPSVVAQGQYPQQSRYPQQGQYPQQAQQGQYGHSGYPQTPNQQGGVGGVRINGHELQGAELQLLAQYGVQPTPGDYWYDAQCGAWGYWGMPTAGFIAPGIGTAPLPAHASNGNSGIFVNGRHLPYSEAMFLQQLAGTIAPGRYWLDAQGNAGPVGQPAQVNFIQLAQQAQAGQGGGQGSEWAKNGARGWDDGNGSGGVWISNPYGGTGTTVTY
ncbi:MAG: hypothetical protein AAF513_08965 [Pseudomonadota bacterium]